MAPKLLNIKIEFFAPFPYFIIRQDAQPDKTVVFHLYIYTWNIKMIVMPPTDKNSTLQNEQP